MPVPTSTLRRRLRVDGGSLDVVVAAALWGTTGTVRASLDGASDVSASAVRLVLGGLVLLALAAATGRPALCRLLAPARNRMLLAAGAAMVAAYQTAFFGAVSRTGVAVGTIVTIGSAPAFAGFIGLVTRRARLGRRWLVATAGAVTGSAILVAAGSDTGARPAGIGLALVAGCAYAGYTTVVSFLVAGGEDDRVVIGALFGASALVMVPALVTGPAGWVLTGRGALAALYLGVVTTAGGYLFFARGLRTTPATTATTLTLAEPAVAALLGVVALGEALGGAALGGLALLVGSLLLLLRPQPPAPPAPSGPATTPGPPGPDAPAS